MGSMKKSRILRAYVRHRANEAAMAYTESRSRFRSSSRCSRKLIVGRSGPLVPRLGIGGRGWFLLSPTIGQRPTFGSRGLRSGHLGVERVPQVRGRLAKLRHTLAKGPSQLGELLGPEDQQGDDEDDE